ncbi:MAG: hypothetical protein ACEY3G_01230 [Arsenophonus sp.]
MSMLFQFNTLFTDMNVFEHITFSLREHTVFLQKLFEYLSL